MMSSATAAPVVGVILAGGLSRRMGADKAFIDLAGRPLIDRVVGRLQPQVAALAINANGDASRFAQFGLPVLPDPIPDFQGPLAGILAGLQWAQQSGKTFVASVPADTPFAPADLVLRLLAGIRSAEIAVAASDDGKDHPTVALWRVSLANDLAAWLARGGDRAVRAWISTRRAVQVAFADGDGGDPFFNVNTPADLERAVERLKREQA
jgi:molybdopterin-guanine dinucleotide biosynthesis protein A